MASARTTRRRLAASVATVLAVTVGAGVLTSPGAVAAPAAAVPAAAPAQAATTPQPGATSTSEAVLPVGADIVSTGETGYLTSRKDGSGATVLEWRRFADGSVVPVTGAGPVGYDSHSDTVVTSDGGTTVSVRDMSPGAVNSYSVDLEAEFKPGAKLVGVVGGNLFVKVPTTQDYHELWQLSQTDGITKKTKRSAGFYSIDFKVIATTGHQMLVLGSNRVWSQATYRTQFWKTQALVEGDTAVDSWSAGTDTQHIAAWNNNSTGAFTADYTAWVDYPTGYTRFVVAADATATHFRMESHLAGARIEGVLWDTLLYGIPGPVQDVVQSPLYARSAKSATSEPYQLLDHYSSVAHAPDGTLLVRGTSADVDGLFRIEVGDQGRPTATLVAHSDRVMPLTVRESNVPTAVSLEQPGTTVPMEWTLSRPSATVDLTLTHKATGRTLTRRLAQPAEGSRFSFAWDGVLGGASAPNGAYTWQITATPDEGDPATASGGFGVTREANPHDFTDNGSTDVLARDASGTLWRDDLFDWPTGTQVTTAKREQIGRGWQIYNQIEAVGNLGGSPVGDLLARDTSGALWLYQGTGTGGFTARAQVGSGWQIYDKLAGGGDLTGDGRADLVARDTSGVLWAYPGTGNASAPFANRVRVGGGWQIYNTVTAVGDIAGTPAGDLVARDAYGVLWLYEGNGAGGFGTRVRIGSGWNAFTQLVGAGDVTADGRPDLIAYGANGTYVYRSTGSVTAPFSRWTTNLYAGEGSAFNSLA
ncbi:FG-GAP repeat domain-containing protein [Streptomyces sp. SudanB25_2051]|uniref:FG-GAP repeat domain-containing protein n=1 Tax=Streptomyces sp. SudanB25_2051 TaxID=3035275 RepID=UPI003F547682